MSGTGAGEHAGDAVAEPCNGGTSAGRADDSRPGTDLRSDDQTAAAQGPLALLESLARRADHGVEQRRREIRDLQSIKAVVARVESLRAADRVVSAYAELVRRGDLVELVRRYEPEDADGVQALVDQFAAEADDAMDRLASTLPAALRERGLRVDRTSRDPIFTVYGGFIEMRVERRRRRVQVRSRGGRKTFVPGDASVVAGVAAELGDRLFGRTFEASGLARTLAAAYRQVLVSEKRRPGDEVAIANVIDVLRMNSSFALDEFNVDLARLVQEPQGRGVELLATRDSDRGGLLLHGLEERLGYVGYLRIHGEAASGGD